MGRKRGGRLHGVEVSRRAADGSWDPTAGEMHEDGRRVCFIPEAGEEFFSQDDAYRVVGLMRSASNVVEWGIAR
jgi:hypothetical protein